MAKRRTKQQIKADIARRVSPYHLFTHTSIFTGDGEQPENVKAALNTAKERYRNWYESWLAEDVKTVLLG